MAGRAGFSLARDLATGTMEEALDLARESTSELKRLQDALEARDAARRPVNSWWTLKGEKKPS